MTIYNGIELKGVPELPMVTQAAREQATIALELATPETAGAVRSLVAATHRLADVVDYLDEQVRLLIAAQAIIVERVER